MNLALSNEEQLDYLDKLYNRLLEHRYRYYVLDAAVLEDFVYDFIEREYNRLALESGVKQMEMVDFDFKDLLAIEAKNRVDTETDYHSLWLKSMRPVWEKLGLPAKKQKEKDNAQEVKENVFEIAPRYFGK